MANAQREPLPQIDPSSIVDNKWYAVRHKPEYGGGITYCRSTIETHHVDPETHEWVECTPYVTFWVVGGEHPLGVGHFDAFWGPFELELAGVPADAKQD